MNHTLSQLIFYVFNQPRRVKCGIVIALDITLCIFSVWLALYLRTGIFINFSEIYILPSVVSVALALTIFVLMDLYKSIFRYIGLSAILGIGRAVFLYGLFYGAIFLYWGVEGVPRIIGVTQPIILFLLIVISRASVRIWLANLSRKRVCSKSLPQALIYGAGNAGRQLAAALENSSEVRVKGFLDDDNKIHGHLLNGLPIYNPANLKKIIRTLSITDIVLALPSVSRQRRNELIDSLKSLKVAVRSLPRLGSIVTGKISFSDVRDLDFEDLLGREQVKPNDLMLNLNTRDKTVMVTGAGGSIGSELCRQILAAKPKYLLLVEISEFALYKIHQELKNIIAGNQNTIDKTKLNFEKSFSTEQMTESFKNSEIQIVPLLASVCDEVRIEEIMKTWKPNTVYHAAAYKHVPLVEHNPSEGIRNNVWGTLVCANSAVRNQVCNFVLISTDKAVRPTNIMGASKRLAEMVLQAMADMNAGTTSGMGHASRAKTIFSIVRFGNVLGSSGSVVPLFREQIKRGGPITLTHSDITRYFMTIPEAAQLVIQAGAMGAGGDVFVLDMGAPVKIMTLARRMVELSGLTVRDGLNLDGDIEIIVTGLRPGEKLYEELLIGDNPQLTEHSRIMKASEQFLSWADLEAKLNELKVTLMTNNPLKIQALLKNLVNGYRPNSEVVDLVHMALEDKEFKCDLS